jgi:hypothetical protein
MQDFVSGQVYATRSLGAPSGVDRLGFAWAPNNTQGLTTTDFNAQTASLLDRIAAAVRDSDAPSDDPGSPACAPAWCTTVLDGAAFTSGWQGFTTWSQPGLALASAPATLAAGTAVPVTAQIQTAGIAQNASSDQSVTFASTSAQGGFSAAATGPWTATLVATIPAGSSSVTVYYTDTLAGSPAISAALSGQPAVAQTQTVTAAALATLALSPTSAYVLTTRSATFTAKGADAYGNAVAVAPTWTLSSGLGRLSTTTGTSTTFTAANKTGTVRLTAASGGITASAAITVAKR